MKKLALILAIFLAASIIGCVQSGIALAAESNVYSFVMDDLQKDSEFSELEYLAVDGDYSLHVIQVAEGSDGELFVYVYQPYGNSRGLLASSITLARGKSGKDYTQGLSFVNYKLTYLNSSGVFYKYKITNFELSSDDVRYYNVAAILRPWDSAIDEPAPNGNKISETPFTVNKMWTATTDGDSVSYKMEETETIRITSKVVGYVNYSDGWRMSFGGTTYGATSAHFVAFSTDWQIDKLMEVEVEFKTQDVQYKYCNNFLHSHYKQKYDYVKGDIVPHDNIVLHDYDNAATNVGVNFADKHEWSRIMTAADFLAYHDDENGDYQLMINDKENIKKQQWVLSFYETPILKEIDVGVEDFVFGSLLVWFRGETEFKYTEVYDLVILRLMFQKDGVTYNLGVIDNKQTGSGKPSNISNTIADWQAKLADISAVFDAIGDFFVTVGNFFAQYWWVAVIIGVLIILGVLSIWIKPLATVFAFIGKGLWFVLKWTALLPFTLLYYGIRAAKKNK